ISPLEILRAEQLQDLKDDRQQSFDCRDDLVDVDGCLGAFGSHDNLPVIEQRLQRAVSDSLPRGNTEVARHHALDTPTLQRANGFALPGGLQDEALNFFSGHSHNSVTGTITRRAITLQPALISVGGPDTSISPAGLSGSVGPLVRGRNNRSFGNCGSPDGLYPSFSACRRSEALRYP